MKPSQHDLRAVACVLLALSVLAACGKEAATAAAAPRVFPALALPRLDGNAVPAPGALRGKVWVINFWATWCEPCRKEMPGLQRLHEAADASKLMVVGITVDTDPNLAREFLLQHQITFANYSDAGQTLARAALGIDAFPATYIVAADGTVMARLTGARDWTGAEMTRLVATALNRAVVPQ